MKQAKSLLLVAQDGCLGWTFQVLVLAFNASIIIGPLVCAIPQLLGIHTMNAPHRRTSKLSRSVPFRFILHFDWVGGDTYSGHWLSIAKMRYISRMPFSATNEGVRAQYRFQCSYLGIWENNRDSRLESVNQWRESVSFWLCYVQYEHNVIGVVSGNNQALVKMLKRRRRVVLELKS